MMMMMMIIIIIIVIIVIIIIIIWYKRYSYNNNIHLSAILAFDNNVFLLLQLPCVRSTMFPGYGFSPIPDFQPHLYTFRYPAESPSMWIPGSGESQDPSESQEGRPLLHPCHHKHVAVCQQETLAFIELQPPVTPKLNGFGHQTADIISDVQHTGHPLNDFRQTLNELNDMQKSCHLTDNEHEISFSSPTNTMGDGELESQNERRTSLQEQTERPRTVTTVCRPLHAALSLPLSLPLSSLYTNRDSLDSQLACSPSSPECPRLQGLDSSQPQRRTSQGSVKEKSIRELAE